MSAAEPVASDTHVVSDPAQAADPVVEVRNLSIFFGQKVALSELSCSFGPGLTGLLGPNGAGKTTLMRAMVGLLRVNKGRVTVGGRDPRADRDVQRAVSLVSEGDALPATLTARQLVRYSAALHGITRSEAVAEVLTTVGLLDVADRAVAGFSKGMRQRAKVAAALVTEPSVLVLDEPLNGADPVQRRALIELFRRLGAEGRTVVVSSHVLHEVEMLVERIVVLVGGRLAAAGDHHAIRDAMADTPRRFRIRTDRPRVLAAALVGLDVVAGVEVVDSNGAPGAGARAGSGVVDVSSSRARDLALALPVVARDLGLVLTEVKGLDDSLEALFRELVR